MRDREVLWARCQITTPLRVGLANAMAGFLVMGGVRRRPRAPLLFSRQRTEPLLYFHNVRLRKASR